MTKVLFTRRFTVFAIATALAAIASAQPPVDSDIQAATDVAGSVESAAGHLVHPPESTHDYLREMKAHIKRLGFTNRLLTPRNTDTTARIGGQNCALKEYDIRQPTVRLRHTITVPDCKRISLSSQPRTSDWESDFEIDGYPARQQGGLSGGEFLTIQVGSLDVTIGLASISGASLADFREHIKVTRRAL